MPVTGGSQSTVTVQVPVPQQVQQRPKAPVSFGQPVPRVQLRTPAQLNSGADDDDTNGAIPPHPAGNLSAVILPWNPSAKKRFKRIRFVLQRSRRGQ